MIRERKKWMNYTYFHRTPSFHPVTTHLFSLVKKFIPLMVRVRFPTMVIDLTKPAFLQHWSKSTRYKINKAEKEGFEVDRGRFLLSMIVKLFTLTAHRRGLKGHTFSDFESRPWVECSAIHFEEVTLAAHIWIIDEQEKRAMLYVNATSQHLYHDDTSLVGRAHYFLLWQDGLYLQSKGITTMDLQGYNPQSGDPRMKGVYAWKEGTRGQQEILYHYYPIWFYVLRKFRNMITR